MLLVQSLYFMGRKTEVHDRQNWTWVVKLWQMAY